MTNGGINVGGGVVLFFYLDEVTDLPSWLAGSLTLRTRKISTSLSLCGVIID